MLFPLWMAVTRLLTKSGDIPSPWRACLDKLLGTTSWYDEFYRVERRKDLFGEDEEHVEEATTESIGRYFTLKDIR